MPASTALTTLPRRCCISVSAARRSVSGNCCESSWSCRCAACKLPSICCVRRSNRSIRADTLATRSVIRSVSILLSLAALVSDRACDAGRHRDLPLLRTLLLCGLCQQRLLSFFGIHLGRRSRTYPPRIWIVGG